MNEEIDDLTAEEREDLIQFAVDEAINHAVDGKVTVQGLVIFLTRFHVNTPDARSTAMEMLKAEGIHICSNEGYGGSGRLIGKG